MSETIAVINDCHVPYHDEAAIGAALSLLAVVNPTKLILAGDIVDFKPLSRFTKEPLDVLSLQNEITQAEGLLKRFRKILPHAQMIYLTGNHEDRLQKYLNGTPELAYLDCLKLENLLHLKELGISYLSGGKPYLWHGWNIVHGDVVRQNAGNTAHGMMTKYGSSGLNGHVHRAAIVHKRNHSRSLTWIENACLCQLDADYLAVADWQQGMSILTYDDNEVIPELVMINNGRLHYRGNTFKA